MLIILIDVFSFCKHVRVLRCSGAVFHRGRISPGPYFTGAVLCCMATLVKYSVVWVEEAGTPGQWYGERALRYCLHSRLFSTNRQLESIVWVSNVSICTNNEIGLKEIGLKLYVTPSQKINHTTKVSEPIWSFCVFQAQKGLIHATTTLCKMILSDENK